jgi:hypothetical protein
MLTAELGRQHRDEIADCAKISTGPGRRGNTIFAERRAKKNL